MTRVPVDLAFRVERLAEARYFRRSIANEHVLDASGRKGEADG
jgi:hypothetical protein